MECIKLIKKRIVPLLLLNNGRLVKGQQFDNYRDVGDPVKSAGVYNSQTADELIILNIGDQRGNIEPLLNALDGLTQNCFMPLSVGGGIRTLQDGVELLKRGADKIVLNSACYESLEIISELSSKYGSQAVVCSIDVRADSKYEDGYRLYSQLGKVPQTKTLSQHINDVITAGAGEIMIQSIDNDGSMAGMDIMLTNKVMAYASVPVLIGGGAGNYQHLLEVFLQSDVSGVVCGSLFNFSDSNPVRARSYLLNYDLPFKLV